MYIVEGESSLSVKDKVCWRFNCWVDFKRLILL